MVVSVSCDRGSIIYNVVDTSPTGVGVGEGGVMVGVHGEDGSQVIEMNERPTNKKTLFGPHSSFDSDLAGVCGMKYSCP